MYTPRKSEDLTDLSTKGEPTLNRLVLGLMVISAVGVWLVSGSEAPSAAQRSAPSVQYLEGNAFQKDRAYSPAVMTQGGKIIWLAGHEAAADANGKLVASDFEGQAREAFASMDRTLKREGGSLQNLVTMTVFVKDPRYGDQFVKLRREMFPDGKYPASALITVSGLAQPGMLVEIQGVAVISN
jgi:2-iminobutanoate/2-iminopropanoate deaminase